MLVAAMDKNRERRSGGRKIVRRGWPFSRYAAGLKVKVDGCSSDVGVVVADLKSETSSGEPAIGDFGGGSGPT